jgi:hypothetical protein
VLLPFSSEGLFPNEVVLSCRTADINNNHNDDTNSYNDNDDNNDTNSYHNNNNNDNNKNNLNNNDNENDNIYNNDNNDNDNDNDYNNSKYCNCMFPVRRLGVSCDHLAADNALRECPCRWTGAHILAVNAGEQGCVFHLSTEGHVVTVKRTC